MIGECRNGCRGTGDSVLLYLNFWFPEGRPQKGKIPVSACVSVAGDWFLGEGSVSRAVSSQQNLSNSHRLTPLPWTW